MDNKQASNGNMWPSGDARQNSQLLSIETDESALTDDDHADKTLTLVMSSESDTTSNAKLEGQVLKCAAVETTDSERELLMVTSTSHSDSEKEGGTTTTTTPNAAATTTTTTATTTTAAATTTTTTTPASAGPDGKKTAMERPTDLGGVRPAKTMRQRAMNIFSELSKND
ncbi:hypothetical protein Ahia01_001052200, partial [Argonauta hians]